ncbi:hypothetical protein Tco_0211980 [Tanacetum coccineum]
MDGGNKKIGGIEESNWWPELFVMAVVVGFDGRSGSAPRLQPEQMARKHQQMKVQATDATTANGTQASTIESDN